MIRGLSTGGTMTASTSAPIYWADMSIPSCTSSPHPGHLHVNKLFDSKAACCEKMLPWLGEDCVGDLEEPVAGIKEVVGATTTATTTGPPNNSNDAAINELGITSKESTKTDSYSGADYDEIINCTTLSITECAQASQCERSRKQLDNGLWIGICSFRDVDETMHTSSSTTVPTVASKVSSGAPSFMPTNEPTQDDHVPTSLPTTALTDSETNAPTAASSTNTPTVPTTTVSTEFPTHSPSEHQEPALYCALSFHELQSGCATAPRCNNGNSCPSGMFCFPYECSYVAETVVDIAAAEDSDDGLHISDIATTPIPSLFPTPSPDVDESIVPRDTSMTLSSSQYSSSDFIVELIEWSNLGTSTIDEGPQLMTSNIDKKRTFAPTSHPTSSPSRHPTNHPISSSPTSKPTVPTMELILPSIDESTISRSRPNDNFGALEVIAVNGGNDNINTDSDRFDALLKFDMSLLHPSYDIVEASIHLFSMNSCNGGGNVYVATDEVDWDEQTVNWVEAPQAQGIRIASLDRQTSRQWQSVDVTSAISAWTNGYHVRETLSFRIMSTADSLCMYAAGESGEEYRPRLVVRYSTGLNRLQTMSGSLYYGYDASPSYGVDSSRDVAVEQSSQQAALQDKVPSPVLSKEEITILATADASISNIRQSINFGTQNAIVVDGGDYQSAMIRGSNEESEQFDALIKFDVSSVDIDKVDSMSLRIHVTKGCDYGGDVYTTQDMDWNQETVTWDDAPSVIGESLGSFEVVKSREWYEVDLSTNILSSDTLTLRLSSSVNSRCMYTSIDRGEDTAPRLIVSSTVPQVMSAEFSDSTAKHLQATQDLLPTTGNFILIVASDDATIDANSPNSVQADGHYLHVDYNDRSRVIRDTLIRFDLSQMHGGVLPRSALLTLFTESSCVNAGTFMSTEGNGEWTESDITWTSAPNYVDNGSFEGGKMVGTFGAVEEQRWYGFSVTDALTEAVLMRKEAITFRLTSGAMQSCSYSSIQSGRPPKILVAF